MKRFVVLVDNPTAEQDRAITARFRDSGLGWWHWVAGAWLIIDDEGKCRATHIRDQIKEVAPGTRNLVLQVSHLFWAGTRGKKPGMFDWIRRRWAARDSR